MENVQYESGEDENYNYENNLGVGERSPSIGNNNNLNSSAPPRRRYRLGHQNTRDQMTLEN